MHRKWCCAWGRVLKPDPLGMRPVPTLTTRSRIGSNIRRIGFQPDPHLSPPGTKPNESIMKKEKG